jgi:hypothetical protein
MEPRGFKRIASIPLAECISFISEGLTLLAENIGGLLQEAKFCWPRGAARVRHRRQRRGGGGREGDHAGRLPASAERRGRRPPV